MAQLANICRLYGRSTALLLIACCALNPACSQNTSTRSCVVELAAPAYPAIAVSARIRVSGVQAIVRIRGGQVESIQQVYPPAAVGLERLFKENIDQAVRRSKFNPGCTDRSETIVYDFVYADPAYRDPPGQERVSFVPPNRIVVADTGTPLNP